MKNRNRLPALLLSLVMAVSLCACGVTADPTGGTAAPSLDPSLDPGAVPSIEVDLTQDPVAFSAGLSGNDVLLTVNGEDIPADLFLYWLFWDCYYFEYNYYYYGITVADFADMLLEDTVTSARYYTLLRQKAAELGCLPTDAQVQEAKADLLAEGQEYYDSLKAAYGLSDESMDYISTLSCYYENLLDAMVPDVTDEMLNSYVYQVKHILLKTVDDNYDPLPEDEIAAQKTLAEDILGQLQAAEGEEQLALFDELMNQYSEDPGLASYPDGYEYTVEDSLVDGFTDAALALDPGEISGIVETDYGYHIMLRGKVADLESYAEDCRAYRLDSELDALVEAMEVTRAPALDALDVANFYERYIAYQDALYDQQQAEAEGVG